MSITSKFFLDSFSNKDSSSIQTFYRPSPPKLVSKAHDGSFETNEFANKSLMNKNVHNISAITLANSQIQEGDDEPEIPTFPQEIFPSTFQGDDPFKKRNMKEFYLEAGYDQKNNRYSKNYENILKHRNSASQVDDINSKGEHNRGAQRNLEPLKYKGFSKIKPEDFNVDARPGEIFQHAEEFLKESVVTQVKEAIRNTSSKEKIKPKEVATKNKEEQKKFIVKQETMPEKKQVKSPREAIGSKESHSRKVSQVVLPKLESYKKIPNHQPNSQQKPENKEVSDDRSPNNKEVKKRLEITKRYGSVSPRKMRLGQLPLNSKESKLVQAYVPSLKKLDNNTQSKLGDRSFNIPSKRPESKDINSVSMMSYVANNSTYTITNGTPESSHSPVRETEKSGSQEDSPETKKNNKRFLIMPNKPVSGKEYWNNRIEILKDIRELGFDYQAFVKFSKAPEVHVEDQHGDTEHKNTKNKNYEPRIKSILKVETQQKNSNIKGIEHLLRLKNISHSDKMREYLRKRGLKEDAKVFCINSKDYYIKRVLERFGWVENPNPDSLLFDLKWTYRESENDYELLSEGQYYNHFNNNQALTIKSELMKNLRDGFEYGSTELSFFPRAYELGQESSAKDFKDDFERTMLGNLIKNLWRYAKMKVKKEKIKEVKQKFWSKEKIKEAIKSKKQKRLDLEMLEKTEQQKRERKLQMYVTDESIKKQKRENRYKKNKLETEQRHIMWWNELAYKEKERREDFLVEVGLTLKALRCIRTIIQQLSKKILEKGEYFLISNLPEEIREALITYSEWEPPYEKEIEEYKKVIGTSKNSWKTPNDDLLYRIYKYHSILKTMFVQYKIDGSKNIWIVKPGSNSKGAGIFLVNTLEEALESGIRNQSRVIQKYIERPLILKDFPIQEMNGKKFDIRQWVLVTSVNPLTVYMFSTCYLRVCSADFDLQDIKNNLKHLTNFSVNKEKYGRNVQNSVCRLEYLKTYLKKKMKVDWDQDIKPQIVNIILKSFSCVSDQLEQRPGCFELYGFDILLDDKCKPWLLEVNLSPACSERAPWLTHLLDSMAIGMFKLVLPVKYFEDKRQNSINEAEDFLLDESYFEKNYTWELILKEDYKNECKDLPANATLEVIGTKLNWRREQVYDRKHNNIRLIIVLQRSIKAFLLRRRIQRRAENAKAKIIQKLARRFIARIRYLRKRQYKALEIIKRVAIKSLQMKFMKAIVQINAAAVIQKHAKQRLKYLQERRAKAVRKLKRAIMRWEARHLFSGLKQVKSIVIIQRRVRKWLDYLRERRKKAIKKLQCFITKHVWKKIKEKAKQVKAAICIERHARGLLGRKRCERIRTENETLRRIIQIQSMWRSIKAQREKAYLKREKEKRIEMLKKQIREAMLLKKVQRAVKRYVQKNREKDELLEMKYKKFTEKHRLKKKRLLFRILVAWSKREQKRRLDAIQILDNHGQTPILMHERFNETSRIEGLSAENRVETEGKSEAGEKRIKESGQKDSKGVVRQKAVQIFVVGKKPDHSNLNDSKIKETMNEAGEQSNVKITKTPNSIHDLYKILKS